MPHVIVKLWPGKSEQQKNRLAEAITRNVADILKYGEESVSVAMQEIKSRDWVEKVYKPDIKNNWDKLYKKPGYDENDLRVRFRITLEGRLKWKSKEWVHNLQARDRPSGLPARSESIHYFRRPIRRAWPA